MIHNSNKYNIEIKATTSKTMFTTVSDANLDCFMWMWVNLHHWIRNANVIHIHTILNPEKHVRPILQHIKSNGENKVKLPDILKHMIKMGDCSDYYRFDLNFDVDFSEINLESSCFYDYSPIHITNISPIIEPSAVSA